MAVFLLFSHKRTATFITLTTGVLVHFIIQNFYLIKKKQVMDRCRKELFMDCILKFTIF